MEKVKISDFLIRKKDIIEITDNIKYKRLTIRGKNQGVCLRDEEDGVNIGTKKQFIARGGQFILSKIDAMNGAFGIVPKEIDEAIITGNFWVFDMDTRKVNIEWFNLFVSLPSFIKICDGLSSGTTHRKYLDEKKFSNFKMFLPSIDEQKNILTNFRNIKNSTDIMIEGLDTQFSYIFCLRQSILQQAVEGKLTKQNPDDEPANILLEKIKVEKGKLIAENKIKRLKELRPITEEEKPFELPQGWAWCRLTDIGELNRGKSKHRPRNDSILYDNGIYPVVQTGNVAQCNGEITTYNNLYNDLGLSQSKLWRKGTLCITIAANIADTGILTFDACFPDSVVGFIPHLDDLEVKYFKWFIDVSKNQIERYAPATAQKNINLEILNNILIPLPPLAEQRRIVEKVENLIALCDKMEKEVLSAKKYASQLIDAVLQEAFSTQEKEVKQDNVIEFVLPRPQKEKHQWSAAARGSMKEGTWIDIINKANELFEEE